MTDIFNEQLIKRTPTVKEKAQQILLWIGAILFSIIGYYIGKLILIGPIVSVAVLFVCYLINKKFNKEYEYIVTNGELDIDMIIGQNKRKRVFSMPVKEFILVASAEDRQYEREFEMVNTKFDVSEGEISSTTYFALYEKEGKKIKLIFSPNEKILKAIKTYAPRQTHIKG